MVHQHIYDSLIATPVSVEDAIAGDIVWGAFRGWISGFLMLIVSLALGVFPFSWFHAGILLVFMAFIGILFASFAMIVTSFAPNFDFFSYYTELCITPMIFFSSVFFPLDKFPGWLKTCSLFLPLTHAVNISRSLFSGQASSMHVGISFIVLAMACLVAFFSGLALMKRRLVK
ncbi:MAG: ABC transporter permease, partial [Candidatus Aureabacteria bacterium]|nr:ABC transporter permease [Candidatus Auribacterota bacterium]